MMARAGRIGFILTLFMIALVTGAYYAQLPIMRAAHHALVSGLVISGLVWLWRTGGLPRAPLTPAALLAIAVWLLSAALAIDPRMSIEHAWGAVSMACLLLVFIRLIERGRALLLVETTFLLAGVVAAFALAHLGSWYFGWGIVPGTEVGWLDALPVAPLPITLPQVYLPLGVSTWLAAFCSPLIVLAFAWGWAGHGAVRIACFTLAGVLTIALLATGSRGGLLALMVGAAVFIALIALHRRHDPAVRRRSVALGLAIVIGAVALALLIGRNPERLAGDTLRLNLWRGALDIAAAHPITGAGVGMFGAAYRTVREPLGWHDQRLGTAHNVVLNTLAEMGAAGGLALLAGAAAVGIALWRRWRAFDDSLPGGRAARWRWAGAAAALIGFGAQSVVDTFVSPALMLLTITLLALATAAPATRSDARPVGWLRAGALLLTIGMTVYGAAMLYSDALYLDFRRAADAAAVEAVSARDPHLALYVLQAADLRARAGDPDADRLYADALLRAPTWDIGWINRAALAEARGDIPAALDYLDRARRINRHNGASAHWGRIAEAHGAADDAAIIEAYRLDYDGLRLPLARFWWETPLRRRAIEAFILTWTESNSELAYRLLREHNPAGLPALVETVMARTGDVFLRADDAWVIGEAALARGDARAALAAFDAAVRLNRRSGDHPASRARARIALDPADPLIEADLALAALLAARHEQVSAIRAQIIQDAAARRRLLANAVPPQIIDQNFEGVSYGARVVGFVPVDRMRRPDLGISQVQPWVELEAHYRAAGDARRADAVRALIDARTR
jgi:tetratricopeptide (TPR) repeat protein